MIKEKKARRQLESNTRMGIKSDDDDDISPSPS
jgi:hypothetical protein